MFKQYLKKFGNSVDFENREVILKLLEPNKSAKLLDMGCGDGDFTLKLGNHIGTKELCGIEIANEFTKQLDKKGIKVYAADLNEPLPIDDEVFDVINSNQVIEHLYRTDVYIKELYRILKPGAFAIVSTANLAALSEVFFLFLGLQPFTASVSDVVSGLGNRFSTNYGVERKRNYPVHGHLRLFTYPALKELFQYHGFIVERIIGVGYPPFIGRVGRVFSRLNPKHAVFLTMKVRKPRSDKVNPK